MDFVDFQSALLIDTFNLYIRETAEKVQAAFKLYLNVSPTVTSWSAASDQFSLVFEVTTSLEGEKYLQYISGKPDSRVCRVTR